MNHGYHDQVGNPHALRVEVASVWVGVAVCYPYIHLESFSTSRLVNKSETIIQAVNDILIHGVNVFMVRLVHSCPMANQC